MGAKELEVLIFFNVRFKVLQFFNILWAYNLKSEASYVVELKMIHIFDRLLTYRVKISYFPLKVGSKELNHDATGGSKEWRERHEKGIFTAGHTQTIFSGELPPPPPQVET